MLIHRDVNLNSAIPFTALSNGLIPIGLDSGNPGAVLRRHEIPVLESLRWADIWRYVGRVQSSSIQVDFEEFKKQHDLSAVAKSVQTDWEGEGLA